MLAAPLGILLWMVVVVLAAVVRRLTPEQALDGAIAGDTAAIRDLVAGLGTVIRARLRRRLCRNPAGAVCLGQNVEELVQQTFLELFARDAQLLRRYDASRGMSLINYVGQIAEREAGRFLRARGTEKRRGEELADPNDSELRSVPADAQSAEGALLRHEEHQRILRELREELSDESFLVFELLYVRLLSAPEVAEMLGCKVQAVYTRRSRIRDTLKRILEGAGDPVPTGAL